MTANADGLTPMMVQALVTQSAQYCLPTPGGVRFVKYENSTVFQELAKRNMRFSARAIRAGTGDRCGEGLCRANLTLPNTYVGVEPEAKPVAVARNVLDQVLVGTFDEVAELLPRHHFDLVICNDVIEHMPDHDHFLEKIKEYISQDGMLVGSIPNVRYLPVMRELLVDRDWRDRESGVLDSTHMRCFTKPSSGARLRCMATQWSDFRALLQFPSRVICARSLCAGP